MTNFADMTTMMTKSKATINTAKSRKIIKYAAIGSTADKESEIKTAIDILKNHKMSAKNPDGQSTVSGGAGGTAQSMASDS